MEPLLIRERISDGELVRIIREGQYEGMAKLAVDVEREVLTLGGEWHSDGQEILAADGSKGDMVWGANFYPWREPRERIIYTSLINLKPVIGHQKMEITDPVLRAKIHAIVTRLLLNDDETLSAE